MKRLAALFLALIMILALTACGGNAADSAKLDEILSAVKSVQADVDALAGGAPAPAPAAPADAPAAPADEPAAGGGDKITINLWAFTDEVPKMVTKYMDMHPETKDKYDVQTTIIATTDGLYQPALDQALAGGDVDIYVAEAAFILKYSQGDAAGYAATYKDLGIDIDKAIKDADIAQYTVDIGSRGGDVVALGYQATGGAFIYRRSIAQEVFGTDDPATIEKEVGPGWDKFFEAAAKLKDAGYPIVSGDGDIWHAIENSSDQGWIVDGKLVIDPKREAFLDYSKDLTDNGWSNLTVDWETGWFDDMGGISEHNAFGFFGPAWLINYTLGEHSGGTVAEGGTAGDWAICNPPIGFFWGGSWVLAADSVVGTEKQDFVRDIIEFITLDTSEEGLQYMWANGTFDPDSSTKDCVASGTVMAKSNGTTDFLGGQNMFDVFVSANQYANGKNLTQYDETINSYWRDAVRQYAAGELSRDDAIAAFKQNVADNLDVVVE